MTAPMLISQHPSEETLAEFVDDRLNPASRPELLAHIAACGECKEIVEMATDLQAADVLPENVRQGWFGRRGWLAAVAGVAAAAVIGFVVLPPKLFGPDVEKVVAAVQTLKERPSLSRLSGVPYNVPPETFRSGDRNILKDDKLKMAGVMLGLHDAKFPDPHAVGLATLASAKSRDDVKNAIDALRVAYQRADGGERDTIAIDLAAALLAAGRWSDKDEYAREALELSKDVLTRKQSPEALWNRALALESLDEKAAIGAWDAYLAVDATSPWAKEALKRRQDLTDF